MKCLFDEILKWEQLHGIDYGDEYNPTFTNALRYAKQCGFKSDYSRDLSTFGRMYTDDQVEQILAHMTEQLRQAPAGDKETDE